MKGTPGRAAPSVRPLRAGLRSAITAAKGSLPLSRQAPKGEAAAKASRLEGTAASVPVSDGLATPWGASATDEAAAARRRTRMRRPSMRAALTICSPDKVPSAASPASARLRMA